MPVFTEPATPSAPPPVRSSPKVPKNLRKAKQVREAKQRALKVRKQLLFLDRYAQDAIIGTAAKHAKVGRATVTEWQVTDEAFARLMREAEENAKDLVEAEFHRRAVQGVAVPTTVAGKREIVRKYSDSLLVLRLKALKPDVYDRQPEREPSVTHHVSQTNNLVVPIERLTDEQFRLLEQIYDASGPLVIPPEKVEPAESLMKMEAR